MSESLRSPTVYTPKTVSEAIANKLKNPDARFWAGGTYIMSRPNFYPNTNQRDIISLAGIQDISRIYHTDRYLEAGAMVTLQQLLTMGSFIFSKEFYNAINNVGSSVLRNQVTIGGSLCTSDMRFTISCILATIGAQAEIRMVSKSSVSRWVPVSKLYDRKGNFIFADNAILTRVRIPTDKTQMQFISRTLDSPMQNPSEAVIFGLQYSLIQSDLIAPSLCIALPNSCFYMSQDFDNLLSTINFPLTSDRIMKISRRLASDLKVSVRQNTSSQLQIERAVRLLEVVLNEINNTYLAG